MSQKLRKSKLTKHEMALWLYLIQKDPFGDRYWQLPSTLEITAELKLICSTAINSKQHKEYLKICEQLQLPPWSDFPHAMAIAD